MADFAGEICQDRGRLGRPSRQRRAPRAPWGLPTPNPRSTLGQPSVNPRSTLGQRSVSSLAIAGRFSLILPDSSIKTEDRRTCISQMVDFPIRKRDFRVRTWSGAFWEPLERKKEKTKCIYKICNPSHRSKFKIFAKFVNFFVMFCSNLCKNPFFRQFSTKFAPILMKFSRNAAE